MPRKNGEFEVKSLLQRDSAAGRQFLGIKGENMGGFRKETKPPKPSGDKPKKPPPARVEDDEPEDGDIATPKRDRNGNDDEPL
jgi:hypothetical protein